MDVILIIWCFNFKLCGYLEKHFIYPNLTYTRTAFDFIPIKYIFICVYHNQRAINRTENETKKVLYDILFFNSMLLPLVFDVCRILATNSRNRKHMWRFRGEMFFNHRNENLTYLAFIYLPLHYITSPYLEATYILHCIHVWKPCPMFVLFLSNKFVSSILTKLDCLTKYPSAERQERIAGKDHSASLMPIMNMSFQQIIEIHNRMYNYLMLKITRWDIIFVILHLLT